MYCQTHTGDVEVLHLNTGKTQRLRLASCSQAKQDSFVRTLQYDPQHMIVVGAGGESLRIVSIEFENLRESMIDLS